MGKSEQKLHRSHLHLICILLALFLPWMLVYVQVHPLLDAKIGTKCIYNSVRYLVGGKFSQNRFRTRVHLWENGGLRWESWVIRIMGADKKVKSSNYFYVHNFYTLFNRFSKDLSGQ